MNNRPLCAALAACLSLAASAGDAAPPGESYVRAPEQPFEAGSHVIRRPQMVHFYDHPGEFGWIVEGADYGFTTMSLITAATEPGGGPPLHTHATEEAHVLPPGARYRVLIGDEVHDVEGPAVVRIPPGVRHTFMNTGTEPLDLVGILPGPRIDYTELGPNPLIESRVAGADAPTTERANPPPGDTGETP